MDEDAPQAPEEGMKKLFALTANIHAMATQDAAGRLARHVALGCEMGSTIATCHRVHKEGQFDGVIVIIAGPKVPEQDADALVNYVKGMIHDIDPNAKIQEAE